MTAGLGSDGPTDPHEVPGVQPSLDLARVAADLETRAGRLERFVDGLASVLDRFEAGARSDDPANLLADFEAPEASHEALRVLTEASTATRHDLAVLRTDIHTLIRASAHAAQPAVVPRVKAAGLAAQALRTRFEAFQRATDERLGARGAGPSGPGGPAAQALQRFIAIAVRTLQDIADGSLLIDREDGHLGLVATAGAAAGGAVVRTVFIPPPPRSRRAGLAVAAAAAAGAGTWSARAVRLVRDRPTRLALELGATGVVAGVILVSSLLSNGGLHEPAGSAAGPGGIGASPGASPGAVAVESASPGTSSGESPEASLAPGQTPPPLPPGTTPGASLPPGTTPPPGTTAPPGTTPPPGATPPPGTTPPPGPTPIPTPSPTSAPNVAAAEFAARIVPGADAVDTLLGQISAAAQAADFPAAKARAQDLEALAAAERSWLQAHPPASCYQAHHTNAYDRYAVLLARAVEIQADADSQNANAIYNDVAGGHADVVALKQAASKAVQACP